MTSISVAVIQLPSDLTPEAAAWNALKRFAHEKKPGVLLLNEMPFGPWISADPRFEPARFDQSCRLHEEGFSRLADLDVPIVLGTRPCRRDGRRINEGFAWTPEEGIRGIHAKEYLPQGEGYFERAWFEPGPGAFDVATVGGALRAGFLICTELMFNEHARKYGRQGAQLLLVPRAGSVKLLPRWRVAAQMAAIVSGCFVLVSCRAGRDARGQEFGGAGWIVHPSGDVVAETSSSAPFLCQTLDLGDVTRAQENYPCNVPERLARA
ncbi:MAG: carbon-nitrogen hydrolase family protein [Planctomycetes bacterium]|nr:carbon-nitrogen hydrolase family protein [Planctomycetota bacterium]